MSLPSVDMAWGAPGPIDGFSFLRRRPMAGPSPAQQGTFPEVIVTVRGTPSVRPSQAFGDEWLHEQTKSLRFLIMKITVSEAGYRKAHRKGQINRAAFELALADCKRKRFKAGAEDIMIRTGRAGILEEFLEMEELGNGSIAEYKKAYEALVHQYVMLSAGGCVRKVLPSPTLESIIRAHYNVVSPGTTDEKPENQDIWCCVTKRYDSVHQGRSTRALTHITPHELGQRNVAVLLGLDPNWDVLQDPKNLLYLDNRISRKFNRGQLTVIPMPTQQGQPQRYKVILTDSRIASQSAGHDMIKDGANKWKDIDGVELQFKNDRRPGRRNLYLHAVLSYLRAQQNMYGGYETLKDKLFTRTAWAKPEAMLRGSMLEYLASRLGDRPLELTVGMFTAGDPGNEPRPEEEEIAKRSLATSFDLKQLRDDAEDEVENEDVEGEIDDDEGDVRVMKKILGSDDDEETKGDEE